MSFVGSSGSGSSRRRIGSRRALAAHSHNTIMICIRRTYQPAAQAHRSRSAEFTHSKLSVCSVCVCVFVWCVDTYTHTTAHPHTHTDANADALPRRTLPTAVRRAPLKSSEGFRFSLAFLYRKYSPICCCDPAAGIRWYICAYYLRYFYANDDDGWLVLHSSRPCARECECGRRWKHRHTHAHHTQLQTR